MTAAMNTRPLLTTLAHNAGVLYAARCRLKAVLERKDPRPVLLQRVNDHNIATAALDAAVARYLKELFS